MSRLSLLICLLGFGMALWPNMISYIYARLTDAIQNLFAAQTGLKETLVLAMLLAAAYLLQSLYDYVNEVCMAKDTYRITRHIKESLMRCAGTVRYSYIDNEDDFRDKLSFTEMFGADQVSKSMQQITVILQRLMSVLAISLTLAFVNVWIVVILLAATIPSVLIEVSQQDKEYKNKTKHMKSSAMSVHLFYMATGANERCKSLLDLRFNNFFPWIHRRWREVSDEYLSEKKELTVHFLVFNMLADVLRNGVYVIVLLLAAVSVFRQPSLGLGIFTLVLTLSQQMQKKLTDLFEGGILFFSSLHFMEDYFNLLDIPKEPTEKIQDIMKRADVTFEDVTFTYHGNNYPSLKGLSVSIKEGEKIAIVGENGSGKSTFVNLLCGLYEPEKGMVKVGGCKVTDNLQSVRKIIAFVPQNFGRYEATVRENIIIADSHAHVSDERIMAIASGVRADELIHQQKNGLDEMIGTFSETGSNLSGGQWQKLALMRALWREKAKIIILDEPTAALDPQAEAELYRNFRKLTGNKTTLFISHRLGICTQVDRILVFKNGQLVENGTHESLLRQGGEYARLYETQAKWYT